MYIIKKNNDDNWIIIKEGNKRATKVFNTKEEAILYAEGKYKDNYRIEDELAAVRHVARKWPKVFWSLFVILILAVVAFFALIFLKVIPNPFLPEYKVELKLQNGDYNLGELELVVKYEDGTVELVKVSNSGVATMRSSSKPVVAYLKEAPLEYSYNPNSNLFNNKKELTITLNSLNKPTSGDGYEATPYVITNGVYRAIGSDKEYFSFKPEAEGRYVIESLASIYDDNVHPKLEVYEVISGVKGKLVEVVDGGAEGSFTKNFKHTLEVTPDFVTNGNSYLLAITGKPRDYTMPVSFDFVIEYANIVENKIYDDLQFHFMEFGNAANGDATYIKAGNNDILIDAGSKSGTVNHLIEHINKYCTDGKLEYVITTHADTDHISGMYGTKEKGTSANGKSIDYTGILYYYEVGTLIDFSLTNKDSKAGTNLDKYNKAVDYAVSNGAMHHTVDKCWNEVDGAKRHYKLSDVMDISMDILYNKHYFESSKDENDYSVVTMFNYNDLHYLFTGDLEISGEESMASYYDGSTPEKTLPEVELFKAGHHGSPTSSNDVLLDIIKPKISVASCVAGANEYTNNNDNLFPSQEFINRIAKHTNRVYVPTMIDYKASIEAKDEVFKPLNGTIIVSSNGTSTGLWASNNLTKLKDSDWFNEEIYMVDGKVSDSKKGDYYTKDTPGAVLKPRRTWPSYGI